MPFRFAHVNNKLNIHEVVDSGRIMHPSRYVAHVYGPGYAESEGLAKDDQQFSSQPL